MEIPSGEMACNCCQIKPTCLPLQLQDFDSWSFSHQIWTKAFPFSFHKITKFCYGSPIYVSGVSGRWLVAWASPRLRMRAVSRVRCFAGAGASRTGERVASLSFDPTSARNKRGRAGPTPHMPACVAPSAIVLFFAYKTLTFAVFAKRKSFVYLVTSK